MSDPRLSRAAAFCLLLSVLFFTTGCETLRSTGLFDRFQKPEIVSVTPRITGLDFRGVDLAFDVGVSNRNAFPIKAPRFTYEFRIADEQFLKSNVASKLDLPANDTGTITLPMQLKYLDLWRSFQQFKDANEVPYTLKGALLISPLNKEIELPIEKSGVIPVLRPPKFSDINVAVPEISFGAARIAVDMLVNNPNAFDLNLEDLGYELKFGGVSVGDLKATALGALEAGDSRKLTLTGKISGFDIVQRILSGKSLGKPQFKATGFIKTPYGRVRPPG